MISHLTVPTSQPRRKCHGCACCEALPASRPEYGRAMLQRLLTSSHPLTRAFFTAISDDVGELYRRVMPEAGL
jgi:hypothetical protein